MRIETSPDDFHGMAVAEGILTARGGATSHAAVVARQIGKPCVAGLCRATSWTTRPSRPPSHERPAQSFAEGDWISVDGSTGEVFLCALPTVEARFEDQPELQQVLGWADAIRRMGVWTNADKPEEAAQAIATARRASASAAPSTCSARVSGWEFVRGAILVANVATRAKAKSPPARR